MARTERDKAWTTAPVHRGKFLKAALGVLAVGVLSAVNPNLFGGEPKDPVGRSATIPDAQVGSLYPLLQATAGRSTLELSFLHDRFKDVEEWKREARPKVLSLLQYAPPKCDPRAEVVERVDCGEYIREKLYFNTTPDIRVPAYLLLPKGQAKRRPAIVALHDHGAFFVWGKEKIVATENEHPALTEFKRTAYSGRSFGSELAKRGYVVIAIDTARTARRRALQNFGFAAAYNLIAAPAAMAGLINPFVAALAMSGSSLAVTLNALRMGAGGGRRWTS